MAKQTSHADDIAMKGGGYYSLATIGAKDVIDGATPFVMRALEAMEIAGEGPAFTMSDMGCADGGTSLGMVAKALSYVREKAPGRPLSMVYSDQTFNDYNALFQIVQGATEIKSDLAAIPGLHIFASATSFYRPIVPAGSLNLGFSATAMHWLSAKPGNISNHVQAVGAEGAELAAFAEQGRKDWETILLHRAQELVSGGRLVLINFCRDEAGRHLGNTDGQHMFNILNQLWQDFLAEGSITEEEYLGMTLPQYYKDPEEFAAPLKDPSSPVYQAGLRQEELETRIVRCPFARDFEKHGDAAAFAKAYIPTIRSWNESIFFGALSPDRPLEERREIIDRYYGTYEAMVRENPEGHAMDYVHAYQVIRKE